MLNYLKFIVPPETNEKIFLFSAVVSAFAFSLCSCQKEISFENNGIPGIDSLPGNPDTGSGPGTSDTSALALNTWRFTDQANGSVHAGKIDTIKTVFDVRPIWNYLKITGWPLSNGGLNRDTMFLITLFLPNPVIDTGNYDMASGIGGDQFFGFANTALLPPYGTNQNFCYYIATKDIAPGFLLRIDSYNNSLHLLKGSFSGQLRRQANITDLHPRNHFISGAFYLRLN